MICVFTLWVCNLLVQALSISDSLDSLLGAMCEEDPELRSALIHVLEVCIILPYIYVLEDAEQCFAK